MTDAMETLWQDVDEKAADELVCCECGDLIASSAVGTIILVTEGDAILVKGDQPAVGDGDTVGVARKLKTENDISRRGLMMKPAST